MRTLLNILVKELLQLLRDPKIVPILFIAPVIQLTILGYAATTDVRRVELVVCDLDHSAASRELVAAFTTSTYFRQVAQVNSQVELQPWLDSSRARIALTIPAGFAADRAAGRQGLVQLVADGSDAMSGTLGLGYAQNALRHLAESEGFALPLGLLSAHLGSYLARISWAAAIPVCSHSWMTASRRRPLSIHCL
jgi:ABC-2 type transport system permease protein